MKKRIDSKYPSKRRADYSIRKERVKDTIASLPEAVLPKSGEWKILEIIGMAPPKSNRILFYAHFPFDQETFYSLSKGPDVGKKDLIFQLHKDLDEYYTPKLDIPRDHSIDIGEVVAARGQDFVWFRSSVQNLTKFVVRGSSRFHVELLHIDYGYKETVDSTLVFPLHFKFSQLPIQLQECCLSNVTLDFKVFPKKFTRNFVEYIRDMVFIAMMDYVSPEGLLYVTLYDHKSTEKKSLNQLIIQEDGCSYSDC